MVYSRTEAVTVHCGQNPQNRVHMTALVLQQYLSFKHGANAHREISRDHVRWISRLENVPIWREKYARCRFRTKNGQNIFIKIIINQICITLIQTNHLLYFKYRYLIHFNQIPLYLKKTIFPPYMRRNSYKNLVLCETQWPLEGLSKVNNTLQYSINKCDREIMKMFIIQCGDFDSRNKL